MTRTTTTVSHSAEDSPVRQPGWTSTMTTSSGPATATASNAQNSSSRAGAGRYGSSAAGSSAIAAATERIRNIGRQYTTEANRAHRVSAATQPGGRFAAIK